MDKRVRLNSAAEKSDVQFGLIKYDIKSRCFIMFCVLMFICFVALKWHNSSIPYWNVLINDGQIKESGLISGIPLPIRSDEWMVNTSFILSQAKTGFPLVNQALGSGKIPFLMGLPTKHILSYMKPNLWGFYLFDTERGFSWYWNFKIFPFLLASFLILMLFTGSHFHLSLFGSFCLILSPAIQWWSINTELFTYGLFSLISLIYVLYSEKQLTIILSSLCLLIFSYSFIMFLYPAYQVPMIYFLLALFIGYMIKNKTETKNIFTVNGGLKISVLLMWLLLLCILLYIFYSETKETIDIISQTVYPGKRSESGGTYAFYEMFRENFALFLDQKNYPEKWMNICEATSFLMLSPVASILVLYQFYTSRKIEPVLLSLIVFQIFIMMWILVGFPPFLTRFSLLFTSPPFRSFYILGFANVIFTVLFLSYHFDKFTASFLSKGLIFLIIFFLVLWINLTINHDVANFFSDFQLIVSSIFVSVLSWLLMFYHQSKYYKFLFAGILFLVLIPNIKINPLSQGLAPYYKSELYKTVSEINLKEPNKKWVVYGMMQTPNFLKAAGITCFNGVQYAPPLHELRILDPLKKFENIYNRFAHIALSSQSKGSESVYFELVQNDFYTIHIDPCSDKWQQMGITFFLFTYVPLPEEIRCMKAVKSIGNMYIYKREDL